ncbi:murein hydrolase activator EnvC family protein [Teredinibacter sp. KSP-S5-2]|uniref:murein hydrolase activator EnvC family protein n=1 Tax=Teredinibacter sp. KSP-S5-2 TaxID=3034506 RepID=UPI00293429E3|nr:peptidoglycan DD-metalloendopeptidase family protein [Teredinibacter sp. KSP-S5-2]WNO08816.1 peptidoglycan DD-metalloendopeptidase family protein [Teredinibacter sp. KSP-S5-2]
MHSINTHIFRPLLIILALFIAGISPCHADEQQDKVRLERLKRSINELKAELEKTKSSRDEVLKSLEKTEKEIGQLNQKAEKLQQKVKDSQSNLDSLRDERSQLNQKKTSQKNQVSQHINAAYRLGTQSNIRLLLNQKDPTTVARNLKYYDYLVKARAQIISDYTDTIERINTIEPEIAYEAQKLQQNYNDLKKKRDQLASAQNQRQATIAKLTQNISSKGQKLEALHKDRDRLERLLNQVTSLIEDIDVPGAKSSFVSLKGKLPWPTQGRIKHQYGSRRADGQLLWEGLMIDAKAGAPVKAIHHGRIVFSDYLRGHGLLIIIDHGSGFMSLYAHNQTLYKEIGEWVEANETIASVGNSGGLDQAALYFQLRRNGKPTNPKYWIKSA